MFQKVPQLPQYKNHPLQSQHLPTTLWLCTVCFPFSFKICYRNVLIATFKRLHEDLKSKVGLQPFGWVATLNVFYLERLNPEPKSHQHSLFHKAFQQNQCQTDLSTWLYQYHSNYLTESQIFDDYQWICKLIIVLIPWHVLNNVAFM